MRFQDLYPNFLTLDDPSKRSFVISYRSKRLLDLTPANIEYKKKKTFEKGSSSLSLDERAVLKSLGISLKDLSSLKEV